MIIHDYSNLLNAIDSLHTEKELEKLRILHDKEMELKTLELKIENNNILKDWDQLKEACRKVEVRLCPYGNWDEAIQGMLMDNGSYFSDGGSFLDCMSSGSHWSDYYGFNGKNGKINWIIKHTTSTTLFKGFDDKQKEVNKKIQMLNLFLQLYEEYKAIQLQRIYAKMGKLTEEIFVLKSK